MPLCEKVNSTYSRPLQNCHFHIFNYSDIDLLMCFGSLFCCKTQLCFSSSSQTDGLPFSCRILQYRAEVMAQSMMAMRPSPDVANHPQTITLPQQCLTVRMRLVWNKVFGFCRHKGVHDINLPVENCSRIPEDHPVASWQIWDKH